jgi:hypothetical protein
MRVTWMVGNHPISLLGQEGGEWVVEADASNVDGCKASQLAF